jgi:excisionase family DNA binding protein
MAHALLDQQTVLPPEPATGHDPQTGRDSQAELLHELAAFLVAPDAPRQTAELVGPDGARVAIPDAVYEALRQVVTALDAGLAITLAPHGMRLTTQQAADMLDISRPTLIKLLEAGEIPFTKAGRHRRVQLRDVLAYKEHARREREAILTEMTQDAEEFAAEVDGFDFLDD